MVGAIAFHLQYAGFLVYVLIKLFIIAKLVVRRKPVSSIDSETTLICSHLGPQDIWEEMALTDEK